MLNLKENIYIIDGEKIKAALGFHFPTRMVVIKLSDETLFVWSPIAGNDAVFDEIDALGPVAHLVAPNHLHHMHLSHWIARYPDAMVWCAPRLKAKRPDLKFAQDLSDQAPIAWAGQIEQVIFRNTITDEVVFFHRASNTIIVTDIIQSMPRDWYSGWRRWIARMDLMTERVPSMPRKYRLGFRGSNLEDAYRIAARWPVQNLIMAHGPVVTENAHSVFKNAFAPVIG